MSTGKRRLAGRRWFKGAGGQTLVETAIAMPLLLAVAFTIINWGYLWFMLLALSASPRMGVEYATQGGAAGTATAPGAPARRDLVWENLDNAGRRPTTCHISAQVCSSSISSKSSTVR